MWQEEPAEESDRPEPVAGIQSQWQAYDHLSVCASFTKVGPSFTANCCNTSSGAAICEQARERKAAAANTHAAQEVQGCLRAAALSSNSNSTSSSRAAGDAALQAQAKPIQLSSDLTNSPLAPASHP